VSLVYFANDIAAELSDFCVCVLEASNGKPNAACDELLLGSLTLHR